VSNPPFASGAEDGSGGRPVEVMTLHSITRLDGRHVGQVVIAASHGGVYAGYCAAVGRVRAVILNDAGIGRESAGIASLAYLDRLGMAAATADSRSCRIGDGDDMRKCGIVSHVNATAALLGCAPGQSVQACADRLRAASPSLSAVPRQAEVRFVARDTPPMPRVVVIDSVSLVEPADAGAIVVTGSHGGLLGGDPASAIKVAALAAVYSDAGVGKDGAGVTRLPALERRGIAAATVSAESSRIGDGRSVYLDGVLSFVNPSAAGFGVVVGDSVHAFIDKVTAGAGPGPGPGLGRG
jgi:hypothetical protein